MFNTSKHSSERSRSRHDAGQSQRGPSTQRSRSARSMSSRQSVGKPEWKIPLWVHCESCFVAYDINPNLSLLSCGHILCRTCLRLDNALLTHDRVPCVQCKTSETCRPINGSLDEKLHGMFQQKWTDPVLQLSLKQMKFMMTKIQNYTKFLSKSFKQTVSLPPHWEHRQNLVKKSIDLMDSMKKQESEISKKGQVLKSEAMRVYKNTQILRAVFEGKKSEFQRKKAELERRKAEFERKKTEIESRKQQRQPQKQRNYQKDMKLISSGRNEQSNQYIGQIKSSHQSANQNRSAQIFRDFSQKVVPPERQNTSMPVHRGESSRFSSDNGSRRSAMPSATFRPQSRDLNSDNRRVEQRQHANNKRLVPSYGYDQYNNPAKRAAHNPNKDLNTSISSVGSSQILNPHNHRNGRLSNDFRIPSSYK